MVGLEEEDDDDFEDLFLDEDDLLLLEGSVGDFITGDLNSSSSNFVADGFTTGDLISGDFGSTTGDFGFPVLTNL